MWPESSQNDKQTHLAPEILWISSRKLYFHGLLELGFILEFLMRIFWIWGSGSGGAFKDKIITHD